MTRGEPIDVWRESGTYVAAMEGVDMHGLGNTPEAARRDFLASCREQYELINRLGEARVAGHLWRQQPVLRAVLDRHGGVGQEERRP